MSTAVDVGREDIERFVRLVFEPGDLVELRTLGTHPQSGVFDDLDSLIESAANLSGERDVYFGLNSPKPDGLRLNGVRRVRAGGAISDAQIERRRLFLIDADPIRESKTASTDEQLAAAIEVGRNVYAYLRDRGFPDPLVACSGNGGHLVYRIDLPADDGGIVERCLAAIAAKFNSPTVKIDTTVSNAARICRFYGTLNLKGTGEAKRLAEILYAPEQLDVVPRELLESLAAEVTTNESVHHRTFDMQAFLEQHEIRAEKKTGKDEVQYDDGLLWELEQCPFADHEKDFKACVFVRRGTACFKCHADKCEGKGWKDFCKVLGADNPNAKKSLAVLLVTDALKRDKFFNDSQGRLYATYLHNGHEETTLFDDSYKSFLCSRYVTESHYQRVLENKPLNTAFQNLRGLAQFDSETHEVNIRTAECDGRIYIDLADVERRVLEVTKDGWNIVGCPNGLHFHRGKTMAALPVPVRGGDISVLRKYVHVTDEDFPIVPALAAAMLLPGRRLCPPAVLVGESGNGKSTVAKVLQRLVDPKHKDQLTGQPKSIHDQLIASQHSWLLSLNNLSKMDQQLSDLLCGLTDGTGFTGRSLYTDSGEFSIVARRPIVITSIKDVVTAPDLLDRSLVIEIPMFEGTAKGETDFWNEFEQDYPAILGALLDGMVAGLRGDCSEVPNIRMLDFLRFASSAASVWGFTAKEMQNTYVRLQQGPARKNIEESEIGRKIVRYVSEHGSLSGDSKELVAKLTWDDKAPKPNEFGRQAREIVPDLKKLGVAVTKKTVKGSNAWTFTRTPTMLVAFDGPDPIAELRRLAPWFEMLGIRVVIDGERASIGVD